MYAIKTEAEEVNENNREHGNCTIFSLSHSVLQALKSNTFNCAMLSEIQLLLYQALVKEINNLCWVLGQLGVGSNRNTDALAESTTTNIGKLMLTRKSYAQT